MGTTTEQSRSRTAAAVLGGARQLVEPAYLSSLDRIAPPMRLLAGYYAGWWDETGKPPNRPAGAAIRPALVLAAAKAVGATDIRQCVNEAVAVELIHDFALVHEDLVDGDPRRRPGAAAWSISGRNAALLAGETLLAVAINELVDRPSVTVLAKALAAVCDGQWPYPELEYPGTAEFGEGSPIAEQRTLLSCACEMGAIAGGAHAAEYRALAEFGRHLEMACRLTERGGAAEQEADEEVRAALACLSEFSADESTEDLRLLADLVTSGSV